MNPPPLPPRRNRLPSVSGERVRAHEVRGDLQTDLATVRPPPMVPGELRLGLELSLDDERISSVPPPSASGLGISWEFIKQACPVSLAHRLRAMVNLLGALRSVHTDVSKPPGDRFHGTVSPANLLFRVDGTALLAASAEERLPQAASYASPEAKARRPDQQSDIYAVGVMLLEAIVNRRLFPPDLKDICTVRHEVHPLWSPFVRDPLLHVALRALLPEPGERWHSAREFADAILSCGDGRVASNLHFKSMIATIVARQADRATPVADPLATLAAAAPPRVLEIEPDEIDALLDWGMGATVPAMPAVVPDSRRPDDPSISREMPRVVVEQGARVEATEERTTPRRSLLAESTNSKQDEPSQRLARGRTR